MHGKLGDNMSDQLLEDMSEICHDEWVSWSKNISEELNEAIDVLKKDIQFFNENGVDNKEASELIQKLESRLERWEKLWIPYADLSEEMKDSDRKYARKMLDLAKREFCNSDSKL